MNRLSSTVSPSITSMIRADHTHVLSTFHKFHASTPGNTKQAIVKTACTALEIHSQLEEEIFYPAMRELATDRAVLDKSVPEHGKVRRLIGELRMMDPMAPEYDSTFMEMMRDVIHHVADEETVLLPDAERLLSQTQLRELGAQMTKRRLQLAAPRAGEIVVNQARAMPKTSLLMVAGAVLAGGYMLRRTLSGTERE